MPSKWVRLLGDPAVKDWVETYRAENTREDYLRSLDYFLEAAGLEPRGFLALDPRGARSRVWEYVEDLVKRDKQNRAHLVKYALSSFYNYHHEDHPIEWSKRTHVVDLPLKKQGKKYIPAHSEVYQMIDAVSNLRDKAIISLMYNTGLGHQAIINLNYGDLRYILEKTEYPLELGVDSRIYPKRFRVNKGVSKYTVLFDRDCADLLRRYCGQVHGKSQDDTPLFLTEQGKRMRTRGVTWQMNLAIGKVLTLERGRTWPYLIRDAFYNRLIDGGMIDAHREYLMGHSLGIRRHYYDENRKEIREQYLRCHFNRGESRTINADHFKELFYGLLNDPETRKWAVEVWAGTIPPEKESYLKHNLEKKRAVGGGAVPTSEAQTEAHTDCDRIVSRDDLNNYLNQGWRFVSKLSGNDYVVRK